MPKNKIDKQKAVTFQLVHRSQQDPLIVDEDAPQRVLVPVKGKQRNVENFLKRHETVNEGEDYSSEDDILPGNVHAKNGNDLDYKVKLPPSVFASKVEEEIGMLGKAAPVSGPQLHLDPEIVAAMDDDFHYSDPENELEDNFMELANGMVSNNLENNEMSGYDSEDLDEINSLLGSDDTSFEKEETKSRFTNYSVTSSVIRRNDQLSLLDERFEKMYVGYDENEIGALDCEEIEGEVSAKDILVRCIGDMETFQNDDESEKKYLASKIKKQLEGNSDKEEEELIVVAANPSEKWDCESILSTYSNIYNHPKLISETKKGKIKINKKTGVPSNAFNSTTLTTKAIKKLNEENEKEQIPAFDQQSVISLRSKNETPEERRERKKLVKDFRRERRLEKKLNTEAFKDEAKRQVKIAINNRNNVQGNKIL